MDAIAGPGDSELETAWAAPETMQMGKAEAHVHLTADSNRLVLGEGELGLVVNLNRLCRYSVRTISEVRVLDILATNPPNQASGDRTIEDATKEAGSGEATGRTHLPDDLVRPARVVAETRDTVPDIKVSASRVIIILSPCIQECGAPCNPDGFAVVQCFQFCELLRISIHEVRQLVQQTRTLETRHILAPCRVQGLACSGDCDVDILRGSCQNKEGEWKSPSGTRYNSTEVGWRVHNAAEKLCVKCRARVHGIDVDHTIGFALRATRLTRYDGADRFLRRGIHTSRWSRKHDSAYFTLSYYSRTYSIVFFESTDGTN